MSLISANRLNRFWQKGIVPIITRVKTLEDKIESGDIGGGSDVTTENPVFTGSISMGRKVDTIIGKNSTAFGTAVEASGEFSHAEGWTTIASGNQSHAEGMNTKASSLCSHAEGSSTIASVQDAHAEGYGSQATGNNAHAENYQTLASGSGSHAEGQNTEASGIHSHAEGDTTKAIGEASHAEGYGSIANEFYSHAEGVSTKATGKRSHAEGNITEASGENAHVEGYQSVASGVSAHAEGFNTQATNYSTHAEGGSAKATGEVSHAEGQSTEASGAKSHAEGNSTKAIGDNSHAEGNVSQAKGISSHAEGERAWAVGTCSHAEGVSTNAGGEYSHASGYATKADNMASFVCGRYNKQLAVGTSWSSITGDVFVVGNGHDDGDRTNAFRVTYQGQVYGLQAFNSSGADYAEFIKPWGDGNPDEEDRVGYFVTIKDGLLEKANSGDYIVGITSGNPSVVGNADEDYYWRYERDEFNRIVMEDVLEKVQKVDDKGNLMFDEKTNMPIMEETGIIIKNARMKMANNYNSDLQNDYVERKDRKEWDYVGMVGVLPLRDDGSCVPGQFCKCKGDGIATVAEQRGFDTYLVIERISDNVVSVLLK